jgi:hypothetical protein
VLQALLARGADVNAANGRAAFSEVCAGLGRTAAPHHRSSTSYQIREYMRCRDV